MPMQTSGAITLAQIQTEFGGSNPIGINEYSFADPFKITNFKYSASPHQQIGMNEFYGSSVRTARITASANQDSWSRYGYSKTNGYFFYISESGQSGNAFGGTHRSSRLATGNRTMAHIVLIDDSYHDYVSIGFYGSDAATNGGFTRIDFYPMQTTAPYRPNVNTNYSLYRADKTSGPNSLPGTSPTVYAYMWAPSSSGNSDVQDVVNLIRNTATGSSPNYFYVKFS